MDQVLYSPESLLHWLKIGGAKQEEVLFYEKLTDREDLPTYSA